MRPHRKCCVILLLIGSFVWTVSVSGQSAEPHNSLVLTCGSGDGPDEYLFHYQTSAWPEFVAPECFAVDEEGRCTRVTGADIDPESASRFLISELEAIALTAAAGHEVMRATARLADEAREMEKAGDRVSRHPHARTGELMNKTGLLDKPEKI